MRRVILSLVFVLSLFGTLGGFVGNISTAHAAGQKTQPRFGTGVQWASVVTKIIPGDPAACAAAIKANPKLANSPQGCNIVLTSKIGKFQPHLGFSPNCSPPGCNCPYGSVGHSFTAQGWLGSYGTELDTIFTYDGNCGTPGLSYENCYRNNWATWPYGLSVTSCNNYVWNGDHTAEDDILVTYFGVVSNSGYITSTANPYDPSISDYCSGGC
jgi:hypothetical protein